MPTVADVIPLRDALADLRQGEPLRHGLLTVIPLTAGPAPEPDRLTLAEVGEAVVMAFPAPAQGSAHALCLIRGVACHILDADAPGRGDTPGEDHRRGWQHSRAGDMAGAIGASSANRGSIPPGIHPEGRGDAGGAV